MQTTRIKIGMLLATAVVATCMPIFAHASEYYSQPYQIYSESYVGAISVQPWQAIATSTTNQTITSVITKVQLLTGSSQLTDDIIIGDCGTSDCNPNTITTYWKGFNTNGTPEYCTSIDTSGTECNFTFANARFHNGTDGATTTGAILTANHYYYISLRTTVSATGIKFFGTAPTISSNLRCWVDTSAGTHQACTTVKSLYGFAFQDVNYSTEGITNIITPTYGQVVSSANNVNFSYTYYINSLSYNSAGFSLVDNTTGQNVDTSSASSTIITSGSSTFNGYLDLVTGHTYTWTPFLFSTITDTYLYGTSSVFFAGSQSNQSIPPSPTPLWNGCSNVLCNGAIFSTSTGILTWNGGTTTTPFGPFGDTLDSILSQKAPFSYLYDIKQVIYELGNGSSTNLYTQSYTNNDAYYTLPTGVLGTTLNNGSTTIKIIDACAVSNYSVVKEIRKAVGYALYLMTGIGMTGMALSIL